MGGSVSAGRNNDELIDNLIEGGLINTQMVERVFRAVDRGTFYLSKHKESAYRDLAWREGLIHISAPCIYTRVMEALELQSGQYFLNIGSGTGYFSSMVGLVLGSNGVNHNIELHDELVNYSKQKVSEFMKTSVHFDDFDFCVPKFVQGNLLNLNLKDDTVLYDRIYVGAGVTDEQENLIKSLLKVNGILIMPLNDSLVKIKRVGENTWDKECLMTVSYASLVTDNVDLSAKINLPMLKPHCLQELCRFKIRQCVRKSIENEFENYYKVNRKISTFNLSSNLEHEFDTEKSRSKNLESDYLNESDNNDDDQEDEAELERASTLSRFRILSPRRDHDHHYHENHQLRLMIYSHLLDSRSNSFEITINPEPSEQNNNEDEPNVVSGALVLVTATTPTESTSSNDPIRVSSSQEIDIPKGGDGDEEKQADSGYSEGSQSSLNSSQNSIIKRKRCPSNQADQAQTSSAIASEENVEETNKIENKSDELNKKIRNSESSCSEEHGGSKTSKSSRNASNRKENLLRKRIMELPLSSNVINFLLYQRDI